MHLSLPRLTPLLVSACAVALLFSIARPPALAAPDLSAQPSNDGFTAISGLDELRALLPRDGVKVRLAPGTYRLDSADSPDFLAFTGNDSHYDFTGVKLEVDTALYRKFKPGLNLVSLRGHRIVLEGLSLETVGGHHAPGGLRGLSILGDGIVVRDIAVIIDGSAPYGYGSYFGIGSDSSASLHKSNGIRVGGIDDQLINARVTMRAFGHGIFIRGSHNALIKNCHVEGALRKTDDILAETSGPAFDRGFKQYTGDPIPAGRMTSLSEDGIRAYPDDPATGRRTTGVTIENCTVTRMRRGVCMAFATGKIVITGTTVTECERSGFHIGGNTTIEDCRADALYTQALDISSPSSRNSRVRLAVLDSRAAYGNSLLAKINGSGHDVVLTEAAPGVLPPSMSVELATDRGFGEGRLNDPRAEKVRLVNRTGASVVLHEAAGSCIVESLGPVTNRGRENTTSPISGQPASL